MDIMELAEKSAEDLRKILENLGEKPDRNASKSDLIDRIHTKAAQARLKADAEARAGMAKKATETLDLSDPKAKPGCEAFMMQHSPLVKVRFVNVENPETEDHLGADVEFVRGGIHFHLFDRLTHILPEVMVCDNPLGDAKLVDSMTKYWQEIGLKAKDAVDKAKDCILSMNIPHRCVRPKARIVRRKGQADKDGQVIEEVRVEGSLPRFMFQILGPAPEESQIGAVV